MPALFEDWMEDTRALERQRHRERPGAGEDGVFQGFGRAEVEAKEAAEEAWMQWVDFVGRVGAEADAA